MGRIAQASGEIVGQQYSKLVMGLITYDEFEKYCQVILYCLLRWYKETNEK